MRSLLRLTGWAALVAGLTHLLQFLVLGIGGALVEEQLPDPAHVADNYWFGLAGLATFTIIALAYLVFFSAGTQLVWPDATGTSLVWRRAMQAAATVGIGGWLFAGANNLAERGFNATAVAEAAGGDVTIGQAALAATYVPQTAAVIVGAVAFAAWFVAFGIRGLRTQQFGWAVAIGAFLAGLVPLLGWVLNVGGIPVIILYFFALGPVLLSKARHISDLPVPEPAVGK